MGSQSHIHLRRAKKVCDGASKQARWTPIVPIAQNRSSVRLHCHIVLKHPLLLLAAARRPLFVISLRRLVAGASCARKFRVDIRTSYRPPEGLSSRRSAGPRGGCGVLCLLHVACVLYDLHRSDSWLNTGTTTGSSNVPVLKRMAFRPQPFFTSTQAGQEWSGLGRVETERVGTVDPLSPAQSRTPTADLVRFLATLGFATAR